MFIVFVLCIGGAAAGGFVNPITDIAWSCTFPITIGGVPLGDDSQSPRDEVGLVCWCKKKLLPEPGVPIGFWEPALLVDVTRKPLYFVGLGGLNLAHNHQSFGPYHHTLGQHAFYHVHVYTYPLFAMLDVLTIAGCLDTAPMDIVYMSECDPLWNDDELSRFLDAEAEVFDTPMAQMACSGDCAAANVGLPLEALYWCSGCLGSVFPLSGTVAAVGSDVQASALMVHRILFKLHRLGLLKGTVGKDGLCQPYTMPHMRKQQYKMQMVFPSCQRAGCHPLGRSDVLWGQGRSFPVDGEDFCYLVWRRRDCCVLGAALAASAFIA